MTASIKDRLFTFEDYCTYDDGTDNRYELVDGKLELMNPPTYRHLLIADFIQDTFKAEIKRLGLPWLTFREAGIRTGWRKSRLSDVYVVTADQITEFLDQSAICQTPPLLVVEVVSPDSIKRDYRFKRSEYAALEILEYWIIDPLKNQVSILLLDEGLFEETIFTTDQQLTSKTFPELSITVEQILSSGNL